MKLVIAEKPSVALTIAKVTHARKNGIMREADTLFLVCWSFNSKGKSR